MRLRLRFSARPLGLRGCRHRVAAGAFAGVLAAAGCLAAASTASADSAVAPGDLQLGISAPGPILSGVATTYTATVTNTSTSTAWGVLVGDQLPSGMTLNTLLNPDVCGRSNSANLPGPAFICSVGDLAPGASESIAFVATAGQPVLYTQSVSDSGTIGGVWQGFVLNGGVFERNALSFAEQVSPGPTDIQITGSASTGSPLLNGTFTYKYQVKDNGPQPAYSVTFDDTLPASLALISVTSDTGTCAGSSGTNAAHCDLGSLAVGAQANIVVTAIAPSTAGSVSNLATVSMAGPDTKPANNGVAVIVQPK